MMIVERVIVILPMIVFKIVRVSGVVLQYLMNVVYAMVIRRMIAFKIVMMNGVGVLNTTIVQIPFVRAVVQG